MLTYPILPCHAKRVLGIFILTLACSFLRAQQPFTALAEGAKGYTLVFYNVENLYDTIDDPHSNDAEFLPGAATNWNRDKYQRKLSNISRVLAGTDTVALPAIIGLTEVENRTVLNDLIATPALKKGKYSIIHENSHDPRGIDVALIYKPTAFREISHHLIPVKYDSSAERSTRECLYVCGILGKKDTLHLIVNHWKSRTGGTENTEAKRIAYARAVRNTVDSLFGVNVKAQIVLMGDFNDTPENTSIRETLKALPYDGKLQHRQLYNITAPVEEKGEGSHYFKSWELFDQIMVSTSLLMQKNTGIHSNEEAAIFKRNWMLYQNSRGLMVPDRTYGSGKYYGGCSDHLPVIVTLWILR